MKKPNALVQLLEDLQSESIRSDVEVHKASKAIIYLTDASAVTDDGVELTSAECALLFAKVSIVERLLDALETSDASLALFDVTVPHPVLEALERGFVAVDEG